MIEFISQISQEPTFLSDKNEVNEQFHGVLSLRDFGLSRFRVVYLDLRI